MPDTRYLVGMTQLNIAIPPSLESWVNARVAQGRYADAGDYLRDLVRRDQENADDERAWLQAEIDKGLASGLVAGEAEDVLDAVMAEDPDFRD